MPAESLVPGYRLVGAFGLDSEYETRSRVNPEGDKDGAEEVEEQVEYVTLEISGIADVDPSLLTSYRLIGLDTPTPFLQLSSSGTIFKGRHHKLLGTELLFTHSPGDSDPPAGNISLLGTTEKRIAFSPVEIRNPASPSTSRTGIKGGTPGKESASIPRKGKKRVNFLASGIEDVVGNTSAGVLKPPALDEQEAVAEPDPSSRSKASGKEKDDVTQDDGIEDMYATDEEDVGKGAAGDGTFEADLVSREKRKPSQDDGEESGNQSIQGPTTTIQSISTTPPAEFSIAQGQHQYGPPPSGSDVIMAIDPALEALYVFSKQPPTSTPGSSTSD